MIASPDQTTDTISPAQRWAHMLVLDILKANLPLPSLAAHLKIPFDTLVEYLNLPEVKAEIDAYEVLCALRARLLGQTARPISLRRLLDVLESPTPEPSGRDRDADQRTLHRHAELIRRTATTIARESRALAPKPAPAPKPPAASGSAPHRTASVSERTSSPSRDGPSKVGLSQDGPTESTQQGTTNSGQANDRAQPEPVLDPPTPTQAPTRAPTQTNSSSDSHGRATGCVAGRAANADIHESSAASSTDNSNVVAGSSATSGRANEPHRVKAPPRSPTVSNSVSLHLCGDSSSPRPSPVPALLRVCGTVRSRDHPAP